MKTLFFCSLTPELVQNKVQNNYVEDCFAWECRLDLLPDIPAFLLKGDHQWMATYRTVKHGGTGALNLRDGEGWERRIDAIKAGAQWLDLELDEANLEQKIRCGRGLGAKIILSGHYFDPDTDWQEIYRSTTHYKPDIIKLIGMGFNFEDFLKQKKLYQEVQIPLVHFFMGEEFKSTRQLSCLYGSPLTFYCPSSSALAAPGQLNNTEVRTLASLDLSIDVVLFAIAGFPVAHSLSPEFHTGLLRAKRKQTLFLNFPIANQKELSLLWPNFTHLKGLSITSPLKEVAVELLTQPVPYPTINTQFRCAEFPNEIKGANTDAMAMKHIFQEFKREYASDGPVVIRILGYGGVGKTAVGVALEMGFNVQVCNRSFHKLVSLGSDITKLQWADRHKPGCDVIFQATPVGLAQPEKSPLEFIPSGVQCIIETIYYPHETKLLKMAHRRSAIKTFCGQEFFTLQAEYQNEIFLETLDKKGLEIT